jgi:multiple sugar transport system permease protein
MTNLTKRKILPLLAAGTLVPLGAWEDFFWPRVIVSSPDKYTAPLGLALFVVEKRTQWDVLFAGSVISTLPMIIVFSIFQRRFIQGISVSALKG